MGVAQALLAALTFGVSAPAAKVLLGATPALLLSGLLYLGAGAFLTFVRLVRRGNRRPMFTRGQYAALVGVIASGGLVAPPMLFWGLAQMPASSAALLLNLEVVFTVLLATLFFGEFVGGRVLAAAGCMAAGGIVLNWTDDPGTFSTASVAILGACALWGLDNNLTRLIAHTDAVFVGLTKGLVAGSVNLALAWSAGQRPDGWVPATAGLGLGAVSIGTSLVLFIRATERLGAARTAAYFALAPFFGTAVAVAVLEEPISWALLAAGALMGIGIWLLLQERHSHRHFHEAGVHTHRHVHDEHHEHEHEGWEGPEPHIHAHATGSLAHEHPHTPDLHHGHPHG
jgi:drug/metabolite transporter (DMT)-like permease